MEVRGWAEGRGKRGRATGVLHRIEFWAGTGTETVTCSPKLAFLAERVADPAASPMGTCALCRRIAAAAARRVDRHAMAAAG